MVPPRRLSSWSSVCVSKGRLINAQCTPWGPAHGVIWRVSCQDCGPNGGRGFFERRAGAHSGSTSGSGSRADLGKLGQLRSLLKLRAESARSRLKQWRADMGVGAVWSSSGGSRCCGHAGQRKADCNFKGSACRTGGKAGQLAKVCRRTAGARGSATAWVRPRVARSEAWVLSSKSKPHAPLCLREVSGDEISDTLWPPGDLPSTHPRHCKAGLA